MLFFLQSQDGSQESACISSYVKVKGLDGFVLLCWRVKNVYLKVYVDDSDSERRWEVGDG